jgi:YbbR domain-containing protein
MEWHYIKILTWVYAIGLYDVTFVNKYYTLHTVHTQKSEKHNAQLKQVKITVLYLNSQYFYTNKTQPLPQGIDEFR